MFKAKNIILILIINYLLIVVFCSFTELIFISNKAQNLQLMIRTAADMALEQVQATDDFFKPGEGFMLKDGEADNPYTMKVPNVSGNYIDISIFESVTGKNDKKEMFEYIYGDSKLSNYIKDNPRVLDIEQTMGYWDPLTSTLQWYRIPRLSLIGSDITGPEAIKAYNTIGSQASSNTTNDIWRTYGMMESEKKAYINGSTESYFMTPISLGITYIDEEMLQYYFMNNLDLLMRSKYATNGKSLNSELGGKGILRGETFRDYIDVTNDLEFFNYNPINNGEFTLIRGEEVKDPNTEALFYKGVKPTIRYKVIDMYDSKNDELLSVLFGTPSGGGSNSAHYKSVNSGEFDYFYSGQVPVKPIVVAEVTFYADVVIPYSTLALREMRTKERDGELKQMNLFGWVSVPPRPNNYADIVREGNLSTGVQSTFLNNSDLIIYRKLFAVAP